MKGVDKMSTHTARGIAQWLLAWADHNQATLSNLKLQKLLYYAQGNHLGKYRSPLFDDAIEAWAHGPVVPTVYHEFKAYGNAAIDVDAVVDDSFNWDDYRDVEDLLQRIWNTYGQYEAWALRDRTHREGPWKTTFEHDVKHLVISHDVLRDFFTT